MPNQQRQSTEGKARTSRVQWECSVNWPRWQGTCGRRTCRGSEQCQCRSSHKSLGSDLYQCTHTHTHVSVTYHLTIRNICQPNSCLYHLLPPPRDSAMTSCLRKPTVHPRPSFRTKRYCSMVSYGLSIMCPRTYMRTFTVLLLHHYFCYILECFYIAFYVFCKCEIKHS